MDYIASQAPLSWDFPGQNTGVGCHTLLQGIRLMQCVLGLVQFLTIMMITQITSADTNLVHIPNSSVFTDLFNPDPRGGGRCYHLHLWKGNTFSGELSSISAVGQEVKGKNQYNLSILPHGTADWKDGDHDARLPGGPGAKNLPASVGDAGLVPGLERSHTPGAAVSAPHSYWSPLALEPMLHNRPPAVRRPSRKEEAPAQPETNICRSKIFQRNYDSNFIVKSAEI